MWKKWKAEGWLMGYSGGPIRHPTSRVYDRDIAALRRGLQLAGPTPTDDPDEDFFVGGCVLARRVPRRRRVQSALLPP